MTFMLLSGRKNDIPSIGQWPGVDERNTDDPDYLSAWESHMMGTALSAHAALLFGCLAGVLREDSHVRSILAIMEAIFFTLEAVDAHQTGFDVPPVAIFTVLATVGAVVNHLEPGIFTKDHGVTKKDKSG